MPKDESPAQEPSATHGAKKKASQRRWIWRIVVLLGICYIINAPLARWLVLYGLDKTLTKQGMEGTAKISGTLSKGFTVYNLTYTGNQGIQSLEIGQLTANYKLSELFSGQIRNLNLSKSRITLDSSKFPKDKEQNKETKTNLKDKLTRIHALVSQPKITISDLEICILKDSEQQALFHFTQLDHEAHSNLFKIDGFSATDYQNRTTPVHDINMVWQAEAATIDRFEVLPDIAIENLSIDWTTKLKGQGQLQILDSQLNVTAGENLTASLGKGQIDTQELNQRFGLEIPLDLTLADADLTISQWKQPIPNWDIIAQLKIKSADYQGYHLADTSIYLEQKKHTYQLSLQGELNSSSLAISANGNWLSPQLNNWWSHTTADYTLNIEKLGKLTDGITQIPQEIDAQSTKVTAKGSLTLKDNNLNKAQINAQIIDLRADKAPLPTLDLQASYDISGKTHANLKALNGTKPTVKIDAHYHLNTKDYEGEIEINETETQWLNTISKAFKTPMSFNGPLHLTWSGKGNATDFTNPNSQQQGKLHIEKLQLELPDTPAFSLNSELSYNWPNNVNIHSLTLSESDWLGTAALAWDGQEIGITKINLAEKGKQLITLNGKIPYSIGIDSSQKFLEQTKPWTLTLKSEPIPLTQLHKWFDIKHLDQFGGTTALNIELSGSPNHPDITGSARANGINGISDQDLSPLHLAFDFHSKNKQLFITGKMLEDKAELFNLDGKIPFTPSAWVKAPDSFNDFLTNAPISANLKINTLPLTRFKKIIPQLETITGAIHGTAKLSGTIQEPKYLIDFDANIPLLRTKKSSIGDIRNIKLNTKFSETQKATTELTAQINGGKFEAGGEINLTDRENPAFDLYLRTKYALVHRDDLLSVRANTDIKLLGNMEEATISGKVGIAESLFYKDIELIPIGVPSSEVAKVNMPALSKKKADDRLPIPEPFADWKLDLTLGTDDPILIRGNVASGNLTGSIKVGGTLTKPAPQGTILANNVKAKLPFSILEIAKGEIKFSPERGLDPILNIRGKSTVGSHDVSVFVHGSASSPKTAFTSYPPLPENEVLTLIATGTTTAGLEDPSVATFKAFQVFLLKWQQRNNKPGGNKLFKAMIDSVDDLNLNVGESDPFTGRKFTSATLGIKKNWNFTAQVDDTQQTRGLVVYVIRFR